MKKTIISLALATVALFAVSSASAQSQDKKDGQKTEKSTERKMNRQQAPNPFEGLNLTEAQQQSLKALAEDQKAQRKEKMEGQKADRQKEAKERKESMKNGRKEYLAKIKAILTPEQYVQFLENNYLNQQLKMTQGRPGMQAKAKGPKANNQRNGKGDKKVTSRRA